MKKNVVNGRLYDMVRYYNMRELVEDVSSRYSDNTAFLFHDGEGVAEIKYSQLGDDVRSFATYLNSLGLEGEKVVVIGKNSYEWALTYLTVTSGVGIIVPMDKDLSEDQIDYLIEDSEPKCIVYGKETEEKLTQRKEDIHYIRFDEVSSCVSQGKKLRENGDSSYDSHKVKSDELGILIYTSGTTGISKGVMLSQNNIMSNVYNVKTTIMIYPEDRCVSVLPLHHTYECMAGFLAFIASGSSIAYNESLRELASDLLLFKPTVIVGVPVLFEKLYRIVLKKYASLKGGNAVLSIQGAFASMLGNSKARRKIFNSVNEAFGGNLNRILCGAASLKPEVFEGYRRFGYGVYQGYGLTETSPVCMVSSDVYSSSNDTGYPIPETEMKLESENSEGVGELLVRGPNVMLGYYKNPSATSDVIDSEGWFHTGDLAKVTEQGTYKIVGRVKSMIVLPSGKKVFPEELEFYLQKSPLVSGCFVFGNEENDNVVVTASIYPDKAELRDAVAKVKGPESDEDKAEKLIHKLVDEVNSKFPAYKNIKRIIIRKTDFEKTTTLKIKRMSEKNKEEL